MPYVKTVRFPVTEEDLELIRQLRKAVKLDREVARLPANEELITRLAYEYTYAATQQAAELLDKEDQLTADS